VNEDYEIKTGHGNIGWWATLEEYDGAPDATGPESFLGSGKTEDDARADLEAQLSEWAAEVSEWAAEERAERGEWEYEQWKDRQHED